MAALTADQEPLSIKLEDRMGFDVPIALLNDEISYVGGIAATDYLGEIQAATDTAGLKVIGYFDESKDNKDDGLTQNVKNDIVLKKNCATYPFAASANSRGLICYVGDDQTVGTRSTNYVACGVVHDVCGEGVYVDMRPAALAYARKHQVMLVEVLVANKDISAAGTGGPICHQGRTRYICNTAGTTLISLPTAVTGYVIGVADGDATAARDVSVKAAAGDVIECFDGYTAAGKQADNTVDEVQHGFTVWQAVDATNWAAIVRDGTFDNWVINNA